MTFYLIFLTYGVNKLTNCFLRKKRISLSFLLRWCSWRGEPRLHAGRGEPGPDHPPGAPVADGGGVRRGRGRGGGRGGGAVAARPAPPALDAQQPAAAGPAALQHPVQRLLPARRCPWWPRQYTTTTTTTTTAASTFTFTSTTTTTTA